MSSSNNSSDNNNILINSELEQLANINQLTIRIGWLALDNSFLYDLEKLIFDNKGNIIPLLSIENYEFLNDEQRLRILKENSDIFLFEKGLKEIENSFAKSLKINQDEEDGDEGCVKEEEEEEEEEDWEYDYVVQSHFKNLNNLNAVVGIVTGLLKENKNISKWSISSNEHALSHPGNLYIKGIPKEMTIDDILPVFLNFGKVISLKIKTDQSGNSLGYGFLSFQLGSQASLCKNELNGTNLNGSKLFINYHVERKERERIYWDNLRERNFNDKKFKGIFIGNLPIYDEDKNLVSPEKVFEKFCMVLKDVTPIDSIVSYYFPKENSNSNIDYGDDDNADTEQPKGKINVETCPLQNEEIPLKGYGFIKFISHDHALAAVEILKDFQWLGNKIIVNKAIQSRPHHTSFNGSPPNVNNNNLAYGYDNDVNDNYYGDNIPISLSSSSLSSANNKTNSTKNKNGNGMKYYHPGKKQINNAIPNYYNYNPHPTTGMFQRNFQTSPYVQYIPYSPVNSFDSSESDIYNLSSSPRAVSRSSITATSPENVNDLFENHEYSYNANPSTVANLNHGSSFNRNTFHYNYNYSPFYNHNGNYKFVSGGSKNVLFPRPLNDQQESNLYIKHIPLSWSDSDLYDFYKVFGEVISAKIITVGGSKNKVTKSERTDLEIPVGSSKGYGFVYFKNTLDASKAIIETNRYKIDKDHILHVSFAQKRSKLSDYEDCVSSNIDKKNFTKVANGPNPKSNRAIFVDYSNLEYSDQRFMYNNVMNQSMHPMNIYQIGASNYIPQMNNWNFHMMPSPLHGGMPAHNFGQRMSVPYIIRAPVSAASDFDVGNSKYSRD
ncbi:hypothetical protein TPHA_0H01140 [Tetrapisispora phaffii CBS 4417]|uniref:RRM domain-containing protein n=1 Tax=Tetrapisispora phaffii (strain ATCC 24235 / CBS 4417 / NBRC 1672 / NRRL Y-8282 / UCD 70-5) TaxID=1071381 RepID=G8BX18_TETPH|nr:hypothetical protein TPHA_0H01140 [Tetrapisispora phaffii CBS 4417]CCE64322.1 hypothetical protein TPHA_0H01140 [Tetrapisispora phaffii CBS 4417]